ncbi:MAG: DUF6734 family protein [Bacteroidota bacterium]
MIKRAIQSYWSKPALANPMHYPWLGKTYAYRSWALSVLTLRNYFEEVVLITDTPGKHLLIDTLQLPYTQVRVELDELDELPAGLWAAGKIKAYATQEAPFVHVDNDIFLWDALPKSLLEAPFLVQSMEHEQDFPDYRNTIDQLAEIEAWMPTSFDSIRNGSSPILAYNAGLWGGNDLGFIHTFCEAAFAFIQNNRSRWNQMNLGDFNSIYEQVLSYQLSKEENVPAQYLMKDYRVHPTMFREVPTKRKFIHLLSLFKGSYEYCRQLTLRLRRDFPEYHFFLEGLLAKHVL